MIRSRPLQRILFMAGLGVIIAGLLFATQTTPEPEKIGADSIVAIVVIGIGAMIAINALMALLGSGEDIDPREEQAASVLPSRLIPIVYFGFLSAIAVAAGLIMAHYAGRTQGIMTFILAFVFAGIVFGIGLALGRTPSQSY